ncbi:iron-sulfur cluster assembly scaffold protein [Nanoarchaeota archaeon]
MDEKERKAAEMYRDKILDLAKNPHNFGLMEQKPTNEHHEENFLCGDGITVQLLVDDGVVQDVKFSGVGCALCTASASLITDKVKLMKTEEINSLGSKDMVDILKIPITPGRMDCAMITLTAIKNALKKPK